MITLRPLDIVVVDSQWYMPHHWMIRQRGAGDKAVHNCIVLDSAGSIENTDFIHGPHIHDNISRYKGRSLSIHRRREPLTDLQIVDMFYWLDNTRRHSGGYDFGQLAAAYLGISSEAYRDDDTRYTCSERSYFLYADNGIELADCDEVLPHPRWVRHSKDFETVFAGVWK